jgi:DNA (cytosine-5)-methyltransferase 1
MSMKSLCCLDLFAGCGGLSRGLKQAGIKVLWSNENNPYATATYRHAHPEVAAFEEDISTFYRRLIDCEANLPRRGEVDLVSGGPPCQGFSGYNRHRSAADPRNSLVESFLDVVELLRPRVVLMENVPGMLSLNNGITARLVLSTLEEMGYQAKLGILQAGYYGLPQNRWRVFILASAAGVSAPEFPQPTYKFPRTTIFGGTAFRSHVIKPIDDQPNLFHQLKPTITVGDSISDLPELDNGGGFDEMDYTSPPLTPYQEMLRSKNTRVHNHRCPKLGPLQLARCKAVPMKIKSGWLDLPRELMPANLLRHGDKRYDNRFGRLHYDGTFNTILTQPHPYWSRVFHPKQHRLISLRESARAQGLPDEMQFFGPLSKGYEQVGNAVPPPVARLLGLEIIRILS